MIYLIITTCIENKHGIQNNDSRKNRYIDCIQQTLSLLKKQNSSIIPIIVENNGLRQTYLDVFDCDILYTNHNQKKNKYKGVNELLDIKEVISQYHIQDDDMIIKLTGRYKLFDLSFVSLIESNPNKHAFIKFFDVYSQQYKQDDCVLGLFAIKCKYLKEFNYNEKDTSEREFAKYINENVPFVMNVPDLSLECCLGDDLSIVCV
tara:strand:+ start:3650 stop:4264 length:615 start_codon:yes stop_codon:yes gene_type:complete